VSQIPAPFRTVVDMPGTNGFTTEATLFALAPLRHRVTVETFVPDSQTGEPSQGHLWAYFETAAPSPTTGETTTLFVDYGGDTLDSVRHGSIRI